MSSVEYVLWKKGGELPIMLTLIFVYEESGGFLNWEHFSNANFLVGDHRPFHYASSNYPLTRFADNFNNYRSRRSRCRPQYHIWSFVEPGWLVVVQQGREYLQLGPSKKKHQPMYTESQSREINLLVSRCYLLEEHRNEQHQNLVQKIYLNQKPRRLS